MSYASAVVFSLPQPNLRPSCRALRIARYAAIGAAQSLGFAIAIYLMVAGAGLVSDPDSTVPQRSGQVR